MDKGVLQKQLSESETGVIYDLGENSFSGREGTKVIMKPLQD